MKHVVVTGASSGIGQATAAELTGRGYHVFGGVRQAEDGERLVAELGSNLAPLMLDVTDQASVQAAAALVRQETGDVGLAGLVNNAGVTAPGPLMHMPLSLFKEQFEVNVFGVLQVTQAFLPALGAEREAPHTPGRIVNVSSVSGQLAYPFLGAYAATKHALEAMSHALRRELMMYGVDVIVVAPGTTRTPLVEKYRQQIARYFDTDYGPAMRKLHQAAEGRQESALPVAVVSRTIRLALEARRPRTHYLLPRKRLTGWFLPRWLPDRWFDRLLARQLDIEL